MPTLETKRLVLRPFTSADAPKVERLAGDRAVADGTATIPHPYETGVAEAWIAMHRSRFAEGREVPLAICLRQGDVIGAIGLVMDEGRSDVGKLGYWIGRPFWNRGYATEAAAAIVRYAFATQGLLRVEACHFLWNRASGRVMEKIGMRREGECRRFVPKWSREEVCLFYAIDRAEWVRGASPLASPDPEGEAREA